MPITFNPKIKRFVDDKGNAVPRVKVRDEVRKLTSHVQNEARKLSKAYQAGSILLPEFHSRMADTLKAGHLVAASIGRGGFDRMSKSDWAVVGSKIAWQNNYLAKFVNRISVGSLSPATTNYRAGLYASALWSTYNHTMMETMKEETSEGKNPERCRLITNSEEGCEECAADEAQGWVSIDDMGEIGSRLCGDFCKCDIEFENDDLNIEDFELTIADAVSDELGLEPEIPLEAASANADEIYNNTPGLSQFFINFDSKDDESYIYNYTDRAYRLANDVPNEAAYVLEAKSKFPEAIEQYKTGLEKALSQLPDKLTVKNLVFRSENDPKGKTLAFLKKNIGKTYQSKNFVSTTLDFNVAKKFRETAKHILYRIESKNGKDISKFSSLRDEKEVLFTRGTKFRIIEVDVENGLVTLEEI